MVALLAGSAVLACFGACGVALLRRVPALDPNEALVYGAPLGRAVASLALLVVACATGLHAWLVVLLGLACAGGAWSARRTLRWSRPPALGGFALVVLAAFALRWLLFWGTAFPLEADGLWASQLSLWGDGAQHLGDITSFAYGGNFPPHHPRFPGHAFNYH